MSSRSSRSSPANCLGFGLAFDLATGLAFIYLLKPPAAAGGLKSEFILLPLKPSWLKSLSKSGSCGCSYGWFCWALFFSCKICLRLGSSSSSIAHTSFEVSPRPACFSSLRLIPAGSFLRPRPWLVYGRFEKLVNP